MSALKIQIYKNEFGQAFCRFSAVDFAYLFAVERSKTPVSRVLTGKQREKPRSISLCSPLLCATALSFHPRDIFIDFKRNWNKFDIQKNL